MPAPPPPLSFSHLLYPPFSLPILFLIFFFFLAYTHSARALSLSLSRGDVIVVSVGDGRIATRIRSQLSLSETRRHRLCRFSAFHRLNFGPLISISPPCSSCAFNLRVNKALLSPASLRRERKTTERERRERRGYRKLGARYSISFYAPSSPSLFQLPYTTSNQSKRSLARWISSSSKTQPFRFSDAAPSLAQQLLFFFFVQRYRLPAKKGSAFFSICCCAGRPKDNKSNSSSATTFICISTGCAESGPARPSLFFFLSFFLSSIRLILWRDAPERRKETGHTTGSSAASRRAADGHS